MIYKLRDIEYIWKFLSDDNYISFKNFRMNISVGGENKNIKIHSLSSGMFDSDYGLMTTRSVEIEDKEFFRIIFEGKI